MDLGGFFLFLAAILSVYGVAVGLYGAIKRNYRATRSAYNATIATACLAVASLVTLGVHFIRSDYRFAYVWQNSNNEMAPWYRISAIWGGMDGSMLLWGTMLTVFAACGLVSCRDRKALPWMVPILSYSSAVFLLIVAFLTNPFRLIPTLIVPENGNGLNPLLQNPSMMIHPLTLYLGFTGFTIPFAYCMSTLLSGESSDDWIQPTRRWTLLAWGFLTVGIILGGHWAYVELGWGGFWAWDPVENASFLPWLTSTAFLHSIIVQERRQMLKIWNVLLCAFSYLLTVFGTFLTRSGVVQSVHAFAEGNIGPWLLGYIIATSVIVLLVIFLRRESLRAENSIESYFSREAIFLFNNLILVGICFATFWGVMFPVFTEAFGYEKSVVGPPFFNQVNGPLFIALLLLMGVGPLLAWRSTQFGNFFRLARSSLVAGGVATLLGIWIDPTRVLAAISFGICVFVAGTILSEFYRAAVARRSLGFEKGLASSLVRVVKRKPQRYGGYLVHFGVVVMAFGITASSIYKIERDISLPIKGEATIGRYVLTLSDLRERRPGGNYSALQAVIDVRDALTGKRVTTLHPEQRFYPSSQQTTFEVDIRSTVREDLYVALGGLGQSASPEQNATPSAALKVFINPLQLWVWFGGVIVFLGAVFLITSAFRLPAVVSQRQTTAVGVRASLPTSFLPGSK